MKGEGVWALWKGFTPTLFRVMSLNFGMLGPYDETKEKLAKVMKPGTVQALLSSAIAGFLASFFSLPFDNIKTKLQK